VEGDAVVVEVLVELFLAVEVDEEDVDDDDEEEDDAGEDVAAAVVGLFDGGVGGGGAGGFLGWGEEAGRCFDESGNASSPLDSPYGSSYTSDILYTEAYSVYYLPRVNTDQIQTQ
jgi:hypothetical protein